MYYIRYSTNISIACIDIHMFVVTYHTKLLKRPCHCDIEHAYRAGLVVLYTIGLRKHNAYFSWFHINSNKHSNTSTHTTAENSIILYVRKRIASRPMAILRTKPGPWSWPSLFCISYWSYIRVVGFWSLSLMIPLVPT